MLNFKELAIVWALIAIAALAAISYNKDRPSSEQLKLPESRSVRTDRNAKELQKFFSGEQKQ